MKCNEKIQEKCKCEELGCEGCYYNQRRKYHCDICYEMINEQECWNVETFYKDYRICKECSKNLHEIIKDMEAMKQLFW